jgi:hypothetical protein
MRISWFARLGRAEDLMDLAGLGDVVRIVGTGKDSRVGPDTAVQADVMPAIAGQNDVPQAGSERKLMGIRQLLIRLPRLLGGQYVVAQPAEFLHNRPGKVFVQVQFGHARRASRLGIEEFRADPHG